MKLGLALICGANETDELKKCLDSCTPAGKAPLYDVIHVTVAADEDAPAIHEIARAHGATTSYFKWIKDFSAARNFAAQQLCPQVDWYFWLDSDDELSPETYDKMLAFRPTLETTSAECFTMPYAYSHTDSDAPIMLLPRERFVRASKVKWCDPIHEYIDIAGLRKEHFDAVIDHRRTKAPNKERNLNVLREQYAQRPNDPRVRFYLAKELLDWNMMEGLPIMEDHVRRGEGFSDNLVVGCIKLANLRLQAGDLDGARRYAWLGRGWSKLYAELDVCLGMVAEQESDWPQAKRWYDEALSKKPGTAGMSQLTDFYDFVPKSRLAFVLGKLGNVAEGRKLIDACLAAHPAHKGAQEISQALTAMAEIAEKTRTLYDGDVKWIRKQLKEGSYAFDPIGDNDGIVTAEVRKIRKLEAAWYMPNEDLNSGVCRIRYAQVYKSLPWARRVKTLKEVTEPVVIIPQGAHDQVIPAKKQGLRVIMDLTEAIIDDRLEALQAADMVTVSSDMLGQMLAQRGINHVIYIPDAIEPTLGKVGAHHYEQYGKDRPIALWCGYGGNSWLASSWLKATVEAAGYQLRVCSEWSDADVPWTLETWAPTLNQCDVLLLPHRPAQPAKSNNRLTQAMSMGIPCIASPILAYKQVITEPGKQGFLCESLLEWGQALEFLKDEDHRRRIGVLGKETTKPFELGNVLGQWHTVCDMIIQRRWKPAASKPIVQQVVQAVDIVIPTYGQTEYLKLCLESIWLETSHPYRIIVSDAGSNEETWKYLSSLQGVTVLGKQGERKNFSEAVNAGLRAGTSKYVVVMNSDIIVSQGWLTRFVTRMDTTERLAACNGLSNCDVGFRHTPGQFDMQVNNLLILRPGMKIEEVQPHLEDLRKFMAMSNDKYNGKYQQVDWCAAYCTIFARSALQECGLFDPQFRSGCEDLDLCRRLTTSGFRCGHDWGTFIYHFGGVSRYADQQARKEEYNAEDRLNHDLYVSKWAKKRIAIWAGNAYEPWDRDKVNAGMAGSETWACELATEFARRNIDVTLYADTDKPEYTDAQGVRWADHDNMLVDCQYRWFDEMIASRYITPVTVANHATRTWMMVHDVCIMGGAGQDVYDWKMAGFSYLSDWHKKNLLITHPKITEGKMFKTHNGVRGELYTVVPKTNSTVWSSSLDRGLFQLLMLLPKIRESIADFTVHVCYGTHNWEEALKQRNDVEGMGLLARIKALMQQPGVVYHGRVSKAALAQLQCQAKVWIYPTWFWETFSITAVENGLAGNGLIYTDIGGLSDTVGDAGIRIPGAGIESNRMAELPGPAQELIVTETVKMIRSEEYRSTWANKARAKMADYTWEKAADLWTKRFGWNA